MSDGLETLVASPVGSVLAFVLGALWGSFANVVIARVPRDMSVVTPGSHCFGCKAPVAWYDNLPILSWFILRGKCRHCGAKFSPRYALVELATGLLFLLTWWLCLEGRIGEGDPTPRRLARFAVYAAFELVLVVISFIDLDTKLIPDKISKPAIVLFLGLGLVLGDRPRWDNALGVIVGYGVVRVIADAYLFLTKRDGMGLGDGKLLAIIGGLLGWRAALFGLFGGALIGSVVGVAALLMTRKAHGDGDGDGDGTKLRHVELPFGPFICAAALVYLFLQPGLELELTLLLDPRGA